MPLTCQRCGEDLPPSDDDDEIGRLLASGASIALVHELCPGDDPPAPDGRYFEVRVQIVEVTDRGPSPIQQATDPDVEELASFVAGVREPDLDAAMRPLALALGEKWLEVEKHARLADPKVG